MKISKKKLIFSNYDFLKVHSSSKELRNSKIVGLLFDHRINTSDTFFLFYSVIHTYFIIFTVNKRSNFICATLFSINWIKLF